MEVDGRNTEELKRDETFVHYLRGLSVAERLALNDAAVRAVLELRAAFKKCPNNPSAEPKT